MKVRPLNNNVVLKLNDRKESTAGGIVLPVSSIRPEDEGTVMDCGDKVEDVAEGDVVGFPAHLGTRFEHGGADWLIIDADKLIYVREWPACLAVSTTRHLR